MAKLAGVNVAQDTVAGLREISIEIFCDQANSSVRRRLKVNPSLSRSLFPLG
jgi:hypothetical protein